MAKRGPRPVAKTYVTKRERDILEAISRSKTAPQRLVERARIVLMSSEAISDQDQAERLGVHRHRVERWRHRWADAEENLARAEEVGVTDADLKAMIHNVLADRPRSGAPLKFQAEEIADIIALACQSPKDCGLPISHWTPVELATEAANRGIVESISPRHLDRILKGSRNPTTHESVLAFLTR